MSSFSKAIRGLQKLKPKDRRKAMTVAKNKFIKQFCSRIRRLRNAKLPSKKATHLRRHSKQIRKLINKKTSLKIKRRMLSQRGGFFGAILGALLPAVLGSMALR